jgi:hypothetical protein
MFVYIKAWFLSKVGHLGSKTRSNLRKKLVTTFLTQSLSNFVRMFVYIKSRFLLKVGQLGSKTRSLGQILEKPCEHDRDHVFDPIFIKFGHNVCLHESFVPFESGSSLIKN